MNISIIVFPGSNCDRDIATAIIKCLKITPQMLWHKETEIQKTDLIILPGGFSHGDYLRSGSIASRAPIMNDVLKKAKNGTPILGICNGFQILTECNLLPGALMPNSSMKFICKYVDLVSSTKNYWVPKNEINKINNTTFSITFSYGRALQQSALKCWGKNIEDITNTQKVFNHRAKMNSLSTLGRWKNDLEKIDF